MCMAKQGEYYMSKLSEKGKWSNKGKMAIRRNSKEILKHEIKILATAKHYSGG